MITVFGSPTCEDTAITTSRLTTWRVPYTHVDIDADPDGAARVVALVGHRVTPTLTVARTDIVVSEPTLEALGDIVRAAGFDAPPLLPREFHGDLTTLPIPSRSLVTAEGGTFSVPSLHGRRQTLLVFAHGAACLPCFGYARQSAALVDEAQQAKTGIVLVVAGEPEEVGAWRHGIDVSVPILADADRGWKAAIAGLLGMINDDAIVLVVDRFGVLRAGSSSREAGGLVDPRAAVEWSRSVGLERPEHRTRSSSTDSLRWPRSRRPSLRAPLSDGRPAHRVGGRAPRLPSA